MQFELIMGLAITALVVLYVYLKKTVHQEENLPAVSQPNPPAVSEDVNLPTEFLGGLKHRQDTTPSAIKNDLENNGPQQ